MNLRQATQQLLKEHQLYAKKQLGQNFLVSTKALNQIITAADIQSNEHILEIGPGTGNLTNLLASKTKNLTLLEKDTDMIHILQANGYQVQNIDALKFDPTTLNSPYKVIANIPYYITSPLINHFLKDQFIKLNQNQRAHPPTLLVLLIQKEVAQKICDPTKNSFLSIGVKTFGEPSIIATVKKNYFVPAPKVDSAILKIQVHTTPLVSCDLATYFRLASLAFSSPRKKLKNNLKPYLQKLNLTAEEFTQKTNIDLNLRAEQLIPQDFEKMVNIN